MGICFSTIHKSLFSKCLICNLYQGFIIVTPWIAFINKTEANINQSTPNHSSTDLEPIKSQKWLYKESGKRDFWKRKIELKPLGLQTHID